MRTEIYARPDVYDMEYAGASNDDAHFFARLLGRLHPRRVLELRRHGTPSRPSRPSQLLG